MRDEQLNDPVHPAARGSGWWRAEGCWPSRSAPRRTYFHLEHQTWSITYPHMRVERIRNEWLTYLTLYDQRRLDEWRLGPQEWGADSQQVHSSPAGPESPPDHTEQHMSESRITWFHFNRALAFKSHKCLGHVNSPAVREHVLKSTNISFNEYEVKFV